MVLAKKNPLLDIAHPIRFDLIKAEHVEPATKKLIEQAEQALVAIETAAGPRTYDNTIAALDRATEDLEIMMTVVGHLESVASTKELREAYNASQPEVSAFFAGMPLRPTLWAAIKAFAETEEAKALTGAQARMLEKTVHSFEREGANLDAAGKGRLSEISRALSEKTAKFGQNVVDGTAAYDVLYPTVEPLKGLPEFALSAAKADAETKGREGYRLTLQATSVIPVLTYVENRDVREKVYRAYNRRGTEAGTDNRKLIAEILALRAERAEVLGFKDFADLVLQERMAHTGAEAQAFVDELTEKVEPAFQKERAALADFAKNEMSPPITDELRPWDIMFVAEKERRARYDFDEELLRPYFPAPAVLSGVFQTAERLFGVKAVENKGISTWHKDVTAYDLVDVRNAGDPEGSAPEGRKLATFYVDLYPAKKNAEARG